VFFLNWPHPSLATRTMFATLSSCISRPAIFLFFLVLQWLFVHSCQDVLQLFPLVFIVNRCIFIFYNKSSHVDQTVKLASSKLICIGRWTVAFYFGKRFILAFLFNSCAILLSICHPGNNWQIQLNDSGQH
jgi:hypothetical protein